MTGAPAAPDAESARLFYVANTHGNDVWVFDTVDYKPVRRFSVGGEPDDIVLSKDSHSLFVSRPHCEDVIAVNPITGVELWRAQLSGGPQHLSLAGDGELLITPIFNQPYVEIIDARSGEVIDRVAIGLGGHGSLVSRDGARAYVGTMVNNVLYVIDVAKRQVIKTVQFNEAVRPFAVSSDETRVYVQLSKLHGFLVVDLGTGLLLNEVLLPTPPTGPSAVPKFPYTVNHGLALTPDGRFLVACGSLDGFVAVYSVPQLELVATIPVGDEPNWVLFNESGTTAYVTNRRSNDVSVITVEGWREVRRLSAGNYPQRMALGPYI